MTADPTPTELELREQLYHAMDGNLRMSRRRELLTAYRDAILAGAAPAVPGAEPEPTPLRWGLNDVMRGDDDTVTVLLSGPDREPYSLELDPERAAVLRQDLAGPDGDRGALRDRIAATLYERERPPRDPHWPDVYAADREVFEAMADAVLAVLPTTANRAAVLEESA